MYRLLKTDLPLLQTREKIVAYLLFLPKASINEAFIFYPFI